MKSNSEYWDNLLADGTLFCYLKDGVPQGLFQTLLGYAYPIMISLITVITIYLSWKLPKDQRKLKSLFVGVGFGTIAGWVWGYLMLHWDSYFPGWIFPPWAVTGIEFIMPIEDLLFYPFCTLLFYIIFRKINVTDDSWNKPWIIKSIIALYVIIIAFYLLFTSICGRAVALMFAIPGLLFFIYSKDRLNVKKYLVFQVILIAINTIWDWWAVSWLHYIPGMAWASQWAYISFDKAGDFTHSKIFLDYGANSWAWIFNNPIEGTPWMGISGGLLNYSVFSACDKFFYREANL